MIKIYKFEFFLIISRAAVVQIPKTPPKYKKEAILERRKMFEKNEGEVKRNKNFIQLHKTASM